MKKVDKQLEKYWKDNNDRNLEEIVARVVKVTVNGQIKAVHEEVKIYGEKLDNHIKLEQEWQKQFQPVLDTINGGETIGKVAKWVVYVSGAIGAIYLGIRNIRI